MPGFNIPLRDCVDPNAFQEQAAFQGPAYTVETARKHRYRLEILEPLGPISQGGGGDGILLFLEKCTRPTPEVDEITIHNGQDEIYRPGKQRWNPIEFTFYEKLRGDPGDFTNEAAEKIYKWWGEAMIDLQRSIHNPIATYYKRAQLQLLDGVGDPVWTYFIYDCWPQKVTPIDLAYSDTDIATITVTLRFNKCEEKQKA
jgi:hypothetical protein